MLRGVDVPLPPVIGASAGANGETWQLLQPAALILFATLGVLKVRPTLFRRTADR